MDFITLIFCVASLAFLLIYKMPNKRKISSFHIKFSILNGFELDCKFRK